MSVTSASWIPKTLATAEQALIELLGVAFEGALS